MRRPAWYGSFPPSIQNDIAAPQGKECNQLNTEMRFVAPVTHKPRFIHSVAERFDESTVVHTSASIAVREAHNAFRPVKELVEGGCFVVHVNEVVDDLSVWDAKSRVTVIEVYESCPALSHWCKNDNATIGEALGMR